MSIPIYTDEHLSEMIVAGARGRGVDVLTAQEDGHRQVPDDQLLLRATTLGRTMVSQDRDMLAHASRFMAGGVEFAGLIYAHQLNITIGQFVEDLELLCLVEDPPYIRNRIEWFPLKYGTRAAGFLKQRLKSAHESAHSFGDGAAIEGAVCDSQITSIIGGEG